MNLACKTSHPAHDYPSRTRLQKEFVPKTHHNAEKPPAECSADGAFFEWYTASPHDIPCFRTAWYTAALRLHDMLSVPFMRRRRISCPKGISCAKHISSVPARNGYHCKKQPFGCFLHGGELGIRTLGTFVHSISSAAPSTTRTTLHFRLPDDFSRKTVPCQGKREIFTLSLDIFRNRWNNERQKK